MTESRQPQGPKQGRFSVTKLEQRIAPAIVKVNGGGHTPAGSANGIPSTNPAGHAPGGHNK